MLYRETGQFKTTYAADMAIFPIRQDRIALYAAAGVRLRRRAAARLLSRSGRSAATTCCKRHPDAVPDPVAGRHRREHPDRLLRPDLARLRRLHGDRRLLGLQVRHRHAGDRRCRRCRCCSRSCSAALCAAVVGILFGIPSLRIKGLYLAVATLAAQFFFDWVFLRVKWFTNYAPSGSVNAPELNFFGWIVALADRALPARA